MESVVYAVEVFFHPSKKAKEIREHYCEYGDETYAMKRAYFEDLQDAKRYAIDAIKADPARRSFRIWVYKPLELVAEGQFQVKATSSSEAKTSGSKRR